MGAHYLKPSFSSKRRKKVMVLACAAKCRFRMYFYWSDTFVKPFFFIILLKISAVRISG